MQWLMDCLGRILRAVADFVDRCLPRYEPAVWNSNPTVQKWNNCYNYACDTQTNTYAQPGHAHGILLNWPVDAACDPVTRGAIADGLTPVNCDEGCGCSECHHQVALVIAPGFDYHWYRKDRDGRWSHKLADSPATNLDNANQLITDPRTANRGPYTVFCGCFCVNKSQVVIS